MSGLIVGCYTPNYEHVARHHLLKSLRDSPLPRAIREIPDRGSWVLNNSACQLYLRQIHDEYPETDFLYIDVDGEVQSDPWKLLSPWRDRCHIGIHYIRDEALLSGTVYLPASPMRAVLLDAWIAKNEERPGRWDQINLQAVIQTYRLVKEQKEPFLTSKVGSYWHLLQHANGVNVLRMPAEFCCIFDMSRQTYPGVIPIIEHFQASRTNKKRGQQNW